ncbi:MAG: carboxypeptidase-like regulatory domain-containing protein, partial [Gemmatimonadales bacterium]
MKYGLPCAGVLLLAASVGGAQSRVAVRGRVVDELTGSNLAYSAVMLYPGFSERFADDAGGFLFPDVAPGSYRLRVRQIGYLPQDVAVPVGDTGDVVLRIALRRLVIQLPPVTVVAQAGCEQPGPPEPATTPELAVIFDQLRENAARYRLLADAYPFRYWLARVHRNEDRAGAFRVDLVDTLDYVSNAGWRYAPGRVVTPEQRGGRGRTQV